MRIALASALAAAGMAVGTAVASIPSPSLYRARGAHACEAVCSGGTRVLTGVGPDAGDLGFGAAAMQVLDAGEEGTWRLIAGAPGWPGMRFEPDMEAVAAAGRRRRGGGGAAAMFFLGLALLAARRL